MRKTILELLKTCPDSIKHSFQEKVFQGGDMILIQGASPEYAYILVDGEAGVYQLTMNGIVFLAYVYSDDDLFGEIELLNEKPVVSNVRANRLCKTVRIGRDDFYRWLQADPAFALFICQQLADKLYASSINSVTNIAYPLKYRLLYFLWNANQQGNKYVKKEDIIAALGSNERSINRIIQELAGLLLVESDRGLVKVNSCDLILQELRKYE
jgi:CRP-like cAMP-binding protein